MQKEKNILSIPKDAPTLPYKEPTQDIDYWIVDDFFSKKDALSIANRCFNQKKWKLGKPYTNELWPGMRSSNALRPKELAKVEDWVKSVTGAEKIWVATSDDVVVDTNTAILVGEHEGSARPHTDSKKLCTFGAVLYLSTKPDPNAGTSFYRLKYPNGALGGNRVLAPYVNLVDALNTKYLPKDAWQVDLSLENRFNRLVLFKGNIVHSASKYFGKDKREKRLAVTFFWKAE